MELNNESKTLFIPLYGEYKEEKLKGLTRFIFSKIYCGKISQKYYKIYEFKLNRNERE